MPEAKSRHVADKVAPLDVFERRFSFIKDDMLRMNVVVAFQYINFLIALMDEEHAEGTTIGSSMFKNMIVYTASIVEGCLHYCLKRHLEAGRVQGSEVMPGKWRSKDMKILFEISDDERVIGGVETHRPEPLTSKTQFIDVNKACRRAGILTDTLFEKAEEIRKLRNKIHLAALGAVDDTYSKNDAERAFSIARNIVMRIERLLR